MNTPRPAYSRAWRLPAVLALIFLLSVSTSPAQRVILLGSGPDPDISRDGRTVAFGSPVVLVRPDGSDSRCLSLFADVKHLNKDGTFLVHESPPNIAVTDLAMMLTTIVATDFGDAQMPDFSADGSTIVYQDASNLIRAMDADGSNQRLITTEFYVANAGGPSLTGDGSLAVFGAFGPPSFASSDIFAAPTDSNSPIPLVVDPSREDFRARISDDGGTITFEFFNLGGGLIAMDGDGTNFRQLFAGQLNFFGEGVNYSALSGDGNIAAFSSFNRVFVVRTDGSGLRQIAGIGGTVDLNGKGDIVVFVGSHGGQSGVFAAGVPGVSPGEMGPLVFDINGTDLTWAGSPAANAYNLYRLPLASLSSGNIGDCLLGGLTNESATDLTTPPPGEGFAYSVTGENGAGNGDVGFSSDGTSRQIGIPCPPIDSDGDSTPDASDVCPLTPNPLQEDLDGDGMGDACDNCPDVSNADQKDFNNDGVGDVCHCHVSINPGEPDLDGDLQIDNCTAQCFPVVIACDNCPTTYNPDQAWLGDPVVQVTAPNGGGPALAIGSNVTIQWSAVDDCGGVSLVDIFVSRTGAGGPFEPIVRGLSNTGSYLWNVTGPGTQGRAGFINVVAQDPGGNEGSDLSDSGFRIQ